MTSRFLENLTLGSLIAPATEEEFRAEYWEQKPLVVHRDDRDYYGDLFTLEDFDQAITRTPDYVKIANASTKKNVSYKAIAVPGLEHTLADMRDGSTLVLDQLHHSEPKLGMLCRVLGPEFGHRFQTNLYLTPPHGKGFTPHWDNHDVFILQVLGSKDWKIEKERRTFPDKGDKMGDDERVFQGEVHAFTLRQGDIAYIPRGYVHAAECGEEPSLHITLGVTAFLFEDFLHAAIRALVQRDPRLRVALPLGFLKGGGDRVAQRAIATLREAADKRFMADLLTRYRDEMVAVFPLDVSQQVVDFFQPRPLGLDDTIGPRRGMAYQMHEENDSVRVNFGTRSIVFLGLFREALAFALNTPVFAIGDLPGDLADEERIVFVERLMQEGLVVRKDAPSSVMQRPREIAPAAC